MDWARLVSILLKGFLLEIGHLAEDFGNMVRNVIRAFPYPVRMLDAFLDFGPTFLGRVVAIPFSGLEAVMLQWLVIGKLHNRLLRASDAVHLMFEAHRAIAQTVTLTRSSGGILTWIATAAGTFVYRTFRHWSFLWKVIKVANEQELIELYIRKLQRRIAFYRIFAMISAGFVALAWAGANLLLTGLAIMLLEGSFQKLLLAQDSKRKRVRVVGKIEVRQNKRKGPDS